MRASCVGLDLIHSASPECAADRSKQPIYADLKRKVRAYFGEEGIERGDHKCTWTAWARYMFFTFMFLVSLHAWINGKWWSLIGMPWFYWVGPSGLMHSGSHSALSKKSWINRAGAYSGSAHVSALHWYHQHVIGHHCHTNIDGYDPDLTHFQHEDDASPGYRLHADQPWMEKYLTWRSAMPMQAFFASAGPAIVNQMKYIMEEKFGCTPVLNQSTARMAWHILGRITIIYFAFVWPFRTFELQKAFFFATFPYGFHGMIFFGFSQVSHLNEGLMNSQLDIKGAQKREWAAHQILTCCDYNTDSLLWRTLSIGLNAQAIHHIFPGVEPCHYGPLSEILAQTCEEHNLPYSHYPNFVAAIRAHVDYVASMNDPIKEGNAVDVKSISATPQQLKGNSLEGTPWTCSLGKDNSKAKVQ